jgi:ABC-type branched-subunit amino acid transport system substrate-binding protein
MEHEHAYLCQTSISDSAQDHPAHRKDIPMKPGGSAFFLSTFCAVFLISAVLAGCESEQQRSASGSQTAGVSDSEILIGSSCPLSGHASFLGTQAIHGVQTYLNHVNDQGGVNGRHIRLIAYDDAYDPALCISNTQKLITEDRVFALTSYVGTPTAVKIMPMVQEAKIPLVGIFSGARVLREPFQRYIINVRASYYEETGNLIGHFVQDLGITRVAIFYQYDEFGFDGLTGTEIALQKHGLKPVAKASYIRGSMDVEDGVDLICGSDAEAVVMIGTYGPCAKFVKLAKQRKSAMIFHAVSFVGTEELAKILGPEAEGIIVTQVVPPPWETVLLPAADQYSRLLSRYFPEEKPSFVGFEGFLNAIVLVEGLKRAGRDLTREGLIDSIEGIRQYSLQIANPLDYGPTDHQGLRYVYFTQIRDGKPVLLTNWEQIKKERSVPGVTYTEIVFGSSLALTGHASYLGIQAIRGASAYLNHVNDKGGVHGRRIRLIGYDDAYEPERCERNTRRLIDDDKVFALTCYVGTPTAVKVLPMIQEAKIPLIGVLSGATALREPFQEYVVNIRASYHQEIKDVIDNMVKRSGFTKIAVFYQEDEYGHDGLTGAKLALSQYGLEPVAAGGYQRGAVEIGQAFEQIRPADPQAVVMIGTYEPCARFIMLAKQKRVGWLFHNVSPVGAEELVKRLGSDAEGVIITQVVPPPWETALLPAAQEYSVLLERYFPGETPSFVGFEGFVNAKVLVQALWRTGREVTREKYIEAIEGMDFYSPGIGSNINFGKLDHQGLHDVYLTAVRNGRIVLVTDWAQLDKTNAAPAAGQGRNPPARP